MYGIFTYIYHTNHPKVGKYTCPMDPIKTNSKPADPLHVSRRQMNEGPSSLGNMATSLKPTPKAFKIHFMASVFNVQTFCA